MKTIKDKPISPGQIKALHSTFRQIGMDNDARHACIHSFTGGRTESIKELLFDEARQLLSSLREPDLEQRAREQEEVGKLLKSIFYLSFQISFLNEGFGNSTEEEFEMNKAKINMFARKKSPCRKNVTEMYLPELRAFKKQLEAIVHNESNSSKKRKNHEK